MRVISVRENPEYKGQIIAFIQSSWPKVFPNLYSDCIEHCIDSPNPLPQWYVLEKNEEFIGCAGLITNDFISRMDLYPWLAALFIKEEHRGNSYAELLIEKAKADANKFGFKKLYLSTDHIGYYEKLGFSFVGMGYHPWGEQTRIYEISL